MINVVLKNDPILVIADYGVDTLISAGLAGEAFGQGKNCLVDQRGGQGWCVGVDDLHYVRFKPTDSLPEGKISAKVEKQILNRGYYWALIFEAALPKVKRARKRRNAE